MQLHQFSDKIIFYTSDANRTINVQKISLQQEMTVVVINIYWKVKIFIKGALVDHNGQQVDCKALRTKAHTKFAPLTWTLCTENLFSNSKANTTPIRFIIYHLRKQLLRSKLTILAHNVS